MHSGSGLFANTGIYHNNVKVLFSMVTIMVNHINLYIHITISRAFNQSNKLFIRGRTIFLFKTFLSFYLSDFLSFYLTFYLTFYPSIWLSICLSIYLSIYLYINLSIFLSIFLSILNKNRIFEGPCLLCHRRENIQIVISYTMVNHYSCQF